MKINKILPVVLVIGLAAASSVKAAIQFDAASSSPTAVVSDSALTETAAVTASEVASAAPSDSVGVGYSVVPVPEPGAYSVCAGAVALLLVGGASLRVSRKLQTA